MLRARKTWLALGLLALIFAGCSKRREETIVRHPEWQYDSYQRIAVLPFKANRPEAAEAARQAEFRLVDLLAVFPEGLTCEIVACHRQNRFSGDQPPLIG